MACREPEEASDVAEVRNGDVRLHVEVDGDGEPVTVLAHGLTNTCMELAAFTPLVAGTKVRFCFRGHGHSSCPSSGYTFADFAGDLDAVAAAFDARCAVGTSLGAGAIMHLLEQEPHRFERLLLLLPAGLDLAFDHPDGFLETARALETMSKDDAIRAVLDDPDRAATFARMPWLADFDLAMWRDVNPEGVARAIREIVRDRPISDRAALRRVDAPSLVICREGDVVHPADIGRIIAAEMPNAELIVFRNDDEMISAIPDLIHRVGAFLAGSTHR
jgi:3-oxoadipate enol-lactonase